MKRSSLNHQSGITLIEILGALFLMGIAILGLARIADSQATDARAMKVGVHLKTISDAARHYVQDNFPAVTAAATATIPAKITVANLVAGGYLPAGTSATNVKGQTACVLVLEPTVNKLNALVVTTGGTAMTDYDLNTADTLIGASGGGLFTANPAGPATSIIGLGGSYNFTRGNFHNAARTCASVGNGGVNLVAGHPVTALWFDQSAYVSGVLYREAVAGRPELNQMQTDIDMNGNSINNALNIAATGTATIGGTVTGGDVAVAGLPGSRNLSRQLAISTVVLPGSIVNKPVCIGGQTPAIYLIPVMYSNRDEGGAIQAVQTWASPAGVNWQVHLRILVDSSLDVAPGSPGDGWITDADFTKLGVNYGRLAVLAKCN